MLSSPLSSSSSPFISFLQFAFALSEQLLVSTLLPSLFSSLFFILAFFISLSLPPASLPLSLWQSRFYHIAISPSFTSLWCTYMSSFFFSQLNSLKLNSGWILERLPRAWRTLTFLSRCRFRDTQLYLICVLRDSARFIEPLTLMDSSGHFIHCRFIRGILNR